MHPQSTPETLPGEEWRPVVGLESLYLVSSLGRVWSIRNHQIMKAIERITVRTGAPRGYLGICLSDNGRRFYRTIHHLVAAAFFGPCPSGMQINHKDGQKGRNVVTNLEYVTGSENVLHSFHVLGKQPPRITGERSPHHKLTDQLVRDARQRHANGVSIRSMARENGVAFPVMRCAILGITWAHVQ